MSWRSKKRQIINSDTFSPRARSRQSQISLSVGQARADEGGAGIVWASTRCERVSPPHRQRRVAAALAQRRHPTRRMEELTPNRCAAARQLMPSSRTAETTRLRKSTDKGPFRAASNSAHPKIIASAWEHRTIQPSQKPL